MSPSNHVEHDKTKIKLYIINELCNSIMMKCSCLKSTLIANAPFVHCLFAHMASLSDLGRSSYVSQRGLADTLKKLQDAGKLAEDEPTSRASIKRARELELSQMTTRFGPIMLAKTLTGDSKESYAVSVLNPVSLWAYLVESCDGLKPVFDEAFSKHKPQINLPWDLIVYCDELVLGNALRHQNNRKLQVFYFSWKQLGPSALAREKCWFH